MESFRSDLKKVDEFDQFRTFIDFFKNKYEFINIFFIDIRK
jgi:hypothetical protein